MIFCEVPFIKMLAEQDTVEAAERRDIECVLVLNCNAVAVDRAGDSFWRFDGILQEEKMAHGFAQNSFAQDHRRPLLNLDMVYPHSRSELRRLFGLGDVDARLRRERI